MSGDGLTPAEREGEARKFELIASWPEAASGLQGLAARAAKYKTTEGKGSSDEVR